MAYLKIPGGALYYEDVGKGPAVVLVHGTTGNSDQWYQQVPAFVAAGFRCIRFDTRGYGRSKVDAGQEAVGTIADDIETIRLALDLGRIFVVGQANGGEGALDYGLDYPAHTRGVVSASSFRTGDAEPAYVALRDRLVPIELRRKPRVELQLSDHYRAQNPDGLKRFIAIDQSNDRGLPSEQHNQKRRAPSTYARLARMSVPTLILAAGADLLTPPALMREVADHIPGAHYVMIKGAGRYAFWEKPEAFNRAVLKFMRRAGRKIAGLSPDIGVRHGRLKLADGYLDYQDVGASYRRILFVGDDPDGGYIWPDQVAAFAQAGYRCISFLRRGAAVTAHDISSIADALDLGSFTLLAAGSAAQAIDFARSAPDRLRGLLLFDDGVIDDRIVALPIAARVLNHGAQTQPDWHRDALDFIDGLA